MTAHLLRLSLLTLGALASVATSQLPAPPTPDSCDDPADVSADSLAVGFGAADPFVPWSDGDLLTINDGQHGGAMISVKLVASSTGSFACADQTTELRHEGRVIGSIDGPLQFYGTGPLWETIENWLLLDDVPPPGSAVSVGTTAGGLSVEKALVVSLEGSLTEIRPLAPRVPIGSDFQFAVSILPSAFQDGDTAVTIGSSDPAVAVTRSDTAVVPPGSSQAAFEVQAVAAGTTTIFARLGSTGVETTLTVE